MINKSIIEFMNVYTSTHVPVTGTLDFNTSNHGLNIDPGATTLYSEPHLKNHVSQWSVKYRLDICLLIMTLRVVLLRLVSLVCNKLHTTLFITLIYYQTHLKI